VQTHRQRHLHRAFRPSNSATCDAAACLRKCLFECLRVPLYTTLTKYIWLSHCAGGCSGTSTGTARLGNARGLMVIMRGYP
jgi:hypothetical protein